MSNLSGKKLNLETKTGARQYAKNMVADINVNGKGYQNRVIKEIDKLKPLSATDKKQLKMKVMRIVPNSAFCKSKKR